MKKLLIIIPYYNEYANFERINNFCEYFSGSEIIDVIVAFNGCSDKTIELINSSAIGFNFINLPIGSKVNAINESINNKIYDYYCVLDADIKVTPQFFRQIVDFLEQNEIDFSTLNPILDFSESNWIVSSYYKFLIKTLEFREGMVSAGIYFFSKRAKERIFPFPNVISDDGYVKTMLKDFSFHKFSQYQSVVKCPADLKSLLKIKTRSHLGNLQFKKYSNKNVDSKNNIRNLIFSSLKTNPIYLIIYLFVNFSAKKNAEYLFKNNDFTWQRDESTR